MVLSSLGPARNAGGTRRGPGPRGTGAGAATRAAEAGPPNDAATAGPGRASGHRGSR
jgi:hypothetical protein